MTERRSIFAGWGGLPGSQAVHCSEAIDSHQPRESIAQAIHASLGAFPTGTRVVVGFPVDQAYFTTRPVQLDTGSASPRVLLREALRSSRVSVDEMLIDVVNSRPEKRELVSIIACPRSLLEPVLEGVEAVGARVMRAEPNAAVLLRAAVLADHSKYPGPAVVRVFLSRDHLMGVLTVKNQPLLWRQTRLPRGDEASSILATFRSLTTMCEQSGGGGEA